jgi:microcystin-dependent protein
MATGIRWIVAMAAFAVMGLAPAARAQECFIGEVRMFAGTFAPRGWAFTNGQILSIAQNTALFAIIGTIYGGNGQTTFALPDLRGRVPVHAGGSAGPGLTQRNLGESGGEESQTQLVTQLAAHAHGAATHSHGLTAPTVTLNASSAAGTTNAPAGAYLAVPNGTSAKGNQAAALTLRLYDPAPSTLVPLAAGAVTVTAPGTTAASSGDTAPAGASQPTPNMQPFLGLNYIICLEGIFPAQN